MLDYLEQEIKVGDKVVLTDSNYNNFDTGIVIKITAKMVQVELTKVDNYVYRLGNKVRRFPNQLIVIKR